MAENRTHQRLSHRADAWLIYLAHPDHPDALRPAHSDAVVNELAGILAAAELHGVLPATVRGAEIVLQSADSRCRRLLESARERAANYTAFGLMLSHHAERVMTGLNAAKLEATVIKGPTFAKRIYPEPWLRTFTDIDVLVAPRHRGKASEIMRGLGFELFAIERGGKDYCEDKWFLASNAKINVEVHADLVHSPKLRRAMSVDYKDAVAAGGGDPQDAAALLLVAAAHGAIGHQFERLQLIVDVEQIASGAAGPIDVERLRSAAERCGIAPALAASLDLAGRVFADPASRELARRFGHPRVTALSRLLLTPRSVARTHDPARIFNAWRRTAFRQLMRAEKRER